MGGDYKVIEARLERAVHLRFGLPAETAPLDRKLIKQADTMAAYVEATALAGFTSEEADSLFTKPSVTVPAIEGISINEAKRAYLARFDALQV